jgi:hypothetical protein
MQTFYLGYRKRGKFVLVINTHVLLIVIRIVGRYTEILTGNVIRAETYGEKPTDKNKVNVKLTALSTGDSAKHKEI